MKPFSTAKSKLGQIRHAFANSVAMAATKRIDLQAGDNVTVLKSSSLYQGTIRAVFSDFETFEVLYFVLGHKLLDDGTFFGKQTRLVAKKSEIALNSPENDNF